MSLLRSLKVAVASLDDVNIVETKVDHFRFSESKPTPMCPDEVSYSAKVFVVFARGMNVRRS